MDQLTVVALGCSLLVSGVAVRHPARHRRPIAEIAMVGTVLTAATLAIAFASVAQSHAAVACGCTAAIASALALRWKRAPRRPPDDEDGDGPGGGHPPRPCPRPPLDGPAIDWPEFDRRRAEWERSSTPRHPDRPLRTPSV